MNSQEVELKLKDISILGLLEQEQIIDNLSKTTDFTKTILRSQLKEIIRKDKLLKKKAKLKELEFNDIAKQEEKKLIFDQLENNYKNCNIDVFITGLDLDLYKKTIDAYAKRIVENNNLLTFKDNKTIYIYQKDGKDKGIYKESGDILLSQKIQSELEEHALDKTINEIINKIRRKSYIDRESILNQPKKYQPVGNGLLNLNNGNLEPFTPKYIYFTKIQINFIKGSKCESFLNDNRFQRALLLYGNKGENGKSVLLKVIGNFLGHKNFCSISLQAIEKNAFALARLANKRANIFYDLPKSALSQTSNFKMIVSGDPVTGEYKGQDSFEFIPNTKMMFSCNEVPRTPDRTQAFFRRWIILQFNKTFKEGSKERIENLDEILSTKEELEGILQFAFKGLQILQKKKKFTENMNSIELKEFWLKKSDSVASFSMDIIEPSKSGEWMTKSDIFDLYQKYTEEHGYEPLTMNVFFKGLKDVLNLEDDYRPTVINKNGESVRLYAMKVKLRDNKEISNSDKILNELKENQSEMIKIKEEWDNSEIIKLKNAGVIYSPKDGYLRYLG